MKKFIIFVFSFVAFIASTTQAHAVSFINPLFNTQIGNIDSLYAMGNAALNLLMYVGWAGMILGLVTILTLLIYKTIFADTQEAMKNVTSYMTKAVIVIVLGLILLAAAFLLTFIGNLIGLDLVLAIPIELK